MLQHKKNLIQEKKLQNKKNFTIQEKCYYKIKIKYKKNCTIQKNTRIFLQYNTIYIFFFYNTRKHKKTFYNTRKHKTNVTTQEKFYNTRKHKKTFYNTRKMLL